MTPGARSLLAAGAANWIYPYLGGQVDRETTIDRIIDAFGTVRPVLMSDVEELVSRFERSQRVGRMLDGGAYILPESIPGRPHLASAYQYTAVVTTQDDQGNRDTIPVVIVSDEMLSRDRIEELANAAVFREDDSEGPGRFIEITLRAGAGTDLIITDTRVTEVWRRER